MFLFSVDEVICSTPTIFQPMELCIRKSIIGVHANSSRPTPLFQKFLEASACSFNEGFPLDFCAPLYLKTNVREFECHGCQWHSLFWVQYMSSQTAGNILPISFVSKNKRNTFCQLYTRMELVRIKVYYDASLEPASAGNVFSQDWI
jgi:hypothetical protein